MRDLYDYDTASYEECIDDLNECLNNLVNDSFGTFYDGDLGVLERRGIRIQNIAQRLNELEEV